MAKPETQPADVDLQNIEVTMEDVQQLLRTNPLAAEQVRNIALSRVVARQKVALDLMREQLEKNGKHDVVEVPYAEGVKGA